MKIISLNTRIGRQFDELKSFVMSHKDDTDIFCFQEIMWTTSDETIVDKFYRANIYKELCVLLPDYQSFCAPYATGGFDEEVDYHLEWSNVIFVKRDISIKRSGIEYLFGGYTPHNDQIKNFQFVTINYKGKDLTIINLHGLWTGGGKGDTEERISQSKAVRKFMDSIGEGVVLVGDFNLDPHTQSMDILRSGMQDLIDIYGVISTRSKLYRNYGKMEFADYAIVSNDIKVKSFEVPYVEASDHLPLILELYI